MISLASWRRAVHSSFHPTALQRLLATVLPTMTSKIPVFRTAGPGSLYDCTKKLVLSTKTRRRVNRGPGLFRDGETPRGPKSIVFKGHDSRVLPMSASTHHIAPILALAMAGLALAGCGTINEKLSAGMGDFIPAWAGGEPADAPPRPGTLKYDEMMKERERLRAMPACERPGAASPCTTPSGSQSSAQTSSGQPSSSGLSPVH
jgi:hypothetical protein